MKYLRAIEEVETWLLKETVPKIDRARTRVKIWDYFDGDVEKGSKDRPLCGVRVAEVSYMREMPSGGMAGASYMQGDMPWGVAFCGQVERCILSLVENWPEAEQTDEFDRLLYLVKLSEQTRV